MEKKIIVYSNPNCHYCKQIKEVLVQKEVDFVEKITKDFQEEWNQIMYTVGMGITPTVLFEGSYFVPGRDFNSADQLIDILGVFKKPTHSNEELLLERTKTLNYNIVSALRDIDTTIKEINKKLGY